MKRPVWLLSMDTDQFCAPPMTTGALKAHFVQFGRTATQSDLALIHFPNRAGVEQWLADTWSHAVRPEAEAALRAGLEPVLAVSCYTWNVAEFLEVVRRAKADVPGLLVVAGGPHVQRAEDFLYGDGIDLVVLGEGETPVPGLYAAGETVGLYHQVYTGSTSVLRGAVFGRTAARHLAQAPSPSCHSTTSAPIRTPTTSATD